MSTILAASDFDLTIDVWRNVYPTPSRREREAWSTDVARMLRGLPYINLSGVVHPADEILALRASVNLPAGSLEIVKADVERVWTKEMSDVTKAAHTFEVGAGQLRFRFACVTPSEGLFAGHVVFLPKG